MLGRVAMSEDELSPVWGPASSESPDGEARYHSVVGDLAEMSAIRTNGVNLLRMLVVGRFGGSLKDDDTISIRSINQSGPPLSIPGRRGSVGR